MEGPRLAPQILWNRAKYKAGRKKDRELQYIYIYYIFFKKNNNNKIVKY
jgi:hypothetical protein